MQDMFASCCLGNEDHSFDTISPIIAFVACYKKNGSLQTSPKDGLTDDSKIFLDGKSFFNFVNQSLTCIGHCLCMQSNHTNGVWICEQYQKHQEGFD